MGGEGRPPEPGAAVVVDAAPEKAKADKADRAKSSKSERKADRPDRPAEKPAASGETRGGSGGGGGSGATGGSSSRRERAAGEKPAERASERPAEKEKEKERTSGTAGGAGEAAAPEKRDRAKAAPEAAASAAQKPSARDSRTSRPSGATEGGLPEEVLTMIAQAKFESQEDKLRDVARFGVALIRDFPKLSAADCTKRVAEVQKALLKYEMQYIRSWEYQERRRRDEIKSLEEEAQRCREEAEAEGEKIVELRHILEKERRRRKRYEGYEESAEEVNRKRTRTDYKAGIASVTDDITQLKQRCQDYEALAKERTQRAQLLRAAVAELSSDLQKEQELTAKVLEAGGTAPDPKASSAASADFSEVVL